MAWWKTAKAGDKIVCTRRKSCFGYSVEVGRVYTVREITWCPIEKDVGVSLAEFVLPIHEGLGEEYAWKIYRFRPVDPASKKADRILASLKPSLLNPIPIRTHETAGGE